MSKTAFEQLLDVLTTGREHERTALSAQPVDENHPIFERACKRIKALNNALGELENEQYEAMELEDRYHEAQDARHDSEVHSQALTEALTALLNDYEELRRACSDERERDGWDAYEQKRAELEPRLSAVRAAATGGA